MTLKLGRKIGHRRSLLRNLATSLILYEKIDTTLAKAKAVRPIVERMISISKEGNLSSYRRDLSFFFDKNASKKIRDELTNRYKDRSSGFVKIFHTGHRLGDNAKTSRCELTDRKVFLSEPKKVVETSDDQKTEKNPIKKTFSGFGKVKNFTKTEVSKGVVTKVRTNTRQKLGDK